MSARVFSDGASSDRSPATPTFTVGPRHDGLEREADRMAASPYGPAPASFARSSAGAGSVPGYATVRAVDAALADAGEPLPPGVRRTSEPRFGTDFAAVRIHRGPAVDQAAAALDARAFTLGEDIALSSGAWQAGSTTTHALLSHELAHVRQGGAGDTVLHRDEGPQGAKEEKKDDNVVVDGLKEAASKAAEKKEVKEKILDPLKKKAENTFDGLPGSEQGIVVGWGIGTYGLALSSMLSSEQGRKALADVNLIAPLNLIPYWPITSFKYKLPEASGQPWDLSASFDGSELLTAGRGDSPDYLNSLKLDANWTVSPDGDSVELKQLIGTLGIAKGLSLTGGLQQGPFLPPSPELIPGPDGSIGQRALTLPALPGVDDPFQGRANVGAFLTFDLARAPFVPRPIREVLGGE